MISSLRSGENFKKKIWPKKILGQNSRGVSLEHFEGGQRLKILARYTIIYINSIPSQNLKSQPPLKVLQTDPPRIFWGGPPFGRGGRTFAGVKSSRSKLTYGQWTFPDPLVKKKPGYVLGTYHLNFQKLGWGTFGLKKIISKVGWGPAHPSLP